MELINSLVEKYAEKYSEPLSAVLQQIADYTYKNHDHSIMLSGHLQGIFLQMMSKLLNPLNILEIGTFTGFSAICLAQGLREGGMVHSIEIREEDALLSRNNIALAGMQEKIKVHSGNAIDIIPTLNKEWDIVFIDADKPGYINYYELVLPQLRSGGLIMADNVFFHGQVLDEEKKGKNAIAIHKFNEHVAADSRVQKLMLTIRDGICLIIKN